MLALSIGFLFVTQMLTAIDNITTLESFTEGIKQSVNNYCIIESMETCINNIKFEIDFWIVRMDGANEPIPEHPKIPNK